MERLETGQTLLIDADDTLWQNNIYFEQAIADFIAYVDHKQLTPVEVRAKLDAVERENTKRHGYGVGTFRRSLLNCFEQLSPEPITEEHHALMERFAATVSTRDIELLAGVEESLPQLAERHRLILMTKGNEAEQADKLARSGLQEYFTAVEIPREKHAEAYREVCTRHGLAEDLTWMVGNSPKSDINPALAAGLHAVYVHHPDTWVLEHESLAAAPVGRRLLQLGSFSELLDWF